VGVSRAFGIYRLQVARFVPRPVAQSEQLFNHDLFNRVALNRRSLWQIVETVIGALYGTVLQGKA
jgi:hypothetical protein